MYSQLKIYLIMKVPASELPRIWWCTTGPLAFLPIHAGGIYTSGQLSPGTSTKLSNFAISSFTPTVRVLVQISKKSRDALADSEKAGMLIISQVDTPEMPSIPGVSVEVEAIKRVFVETSTRYYCLEGQDAGVDRVKEQMDTYSSVHFACHACQDIVNPLNSGFYLHDGRLELSEIIKKHIAGADLAFLSACQTSTGDEKLSEEAVHLAGGMLAAGYRGVVATMWSIDDIHGPKLAEYFYENLLKKEVDIKSDSKELPSEGAARALHYATQQIHQILDNSEEGLLAWVPYVHFGA